MLVVTIITFVGLLLLLVLVHEWGHFITAKKAGCNVEEFGFGFPPRLFSIVRGGTRYSFNLLPIGGFVKIEGEDMNEDNPGPGSFAGKSAGWRIAILSAGVAMNMVLAAVLLSIQAGIGMPVAVTDDNAAHLTDHKTYILEVVEGSPAAEAGLKKFDRIVTIGSVSDPTMEDIQSVIENAKGSELALQVDRQGRDISATLIPREDPPEGEGAMGVSLASTGLEKAPWWRAPWEGVTRTFEMTGAIISQFGSLLRRMFSEGDVSDTLTGPVGIAVYTQEATQMGLSYLLEFGALISINLAIINILPIPALDGGRIVFVIIEKLVGKRVPGKVEAITHTTGFALLIALMILMTIKDVNRYF